ncbi:MAG: adenosylcobinamide-GDP ribazoletransferase [Porticoccaceae bacterium]|jgi:adenosylcobinamide-GDP ribazoletransferase|nr:adenosylcobinamide-GDP ribazoletransferase [Porticoccaceae bacterium]
MKRLIDPNFEWLSFLAAMGLMSRLPIGAAEVGPQHRARSPIWYPAVGLVLGIFLAAFSLIFPQNWPSPVEAALLLILWVSFTGALHLDGLADAADAWVGGMGDRQRTLDIMKDPTCGPMAVVVLVLALLLKFVLIFSLVQSDGWPALLVIPFMARAWLLPILFSMPYARAGKFDPQTVQTSENQREQGGMASDIASGLSIRAAQISFGLTQLLAILLLSSYFFGSGLGLGFWIGSLIASFTLFVLLRWQFLSRAGGYTGDLLGASIELQELILLIISIGVIGSS